VHVEAEATIADEVEGDVVGVEERDAEEVGGVVGGVVNGEGETSLPQQLYKYPRLFCLFCLFFSSSCALGCSTTGSRVWSFRRKEGLSFILRWWIAPTECAR
jgi:hypothetical protein